MGGMGVLYDLAVRVSFGTVGMAGIGTAMTALQRLQNQAGLTQAAVDRMRGGFQTMLGGLALMGAGLMGVNVIGGWVAAAGQLQQAMIGVKLATVGTAAQLNAIQAASFGIASKTLFSASDVATMAQIAGMSGLNNRALLLSALPSLAAGAELDYRLKGVPYTSSTAAMVSVAMEFHAKTAKQFSDIFNTMGRADVLSTLPPQELATALARIAPAVNAFGLKATDAIGLIALSSNMGLTSGQGGASRIQAMFKGLVPTLAGHGLHNATFARLQQLGAGQFFDKGSFTGVTPMLESVMNAMSKIHDQAKRLAVVQAVFQTSGGSAMSVLANQSSVDRYKEILTLLGPASQGGLASAAVMRDTELGGWVGQTTELATNLKSISIILGTALLPPLTAVVALLARVTGGIGLFLQQNPGLASTLAIFSAIAAVGATVAGAIIAVAGAMTILSASTLLAGVALAPIIGTFLALTAAIALVATAFTQGGPLAGFAALGVAVLTVGPLLSGLIGTVWDLTFAWRAMAAAEALSLSTTALGGMAGVAALLERLSLWAGPIGVLASGVLNVGSALGTLASAGASALLALSPLFAAVGVLLGEFALLGLLSRAAGPWHDPRGHAGQILTHNGHQYRIVGSGLGMHVVPLPSTLPPPNRGGFPGIPVPAPRHSAPAPHPVAARHAPPPGYGGPAPHTGAAPLAVHITNHFHGADHQTMGHLATAVGEKVHEQIGKALQHDLIHGSILPHGLQPTGFGF